MIYHEELRRLVEQYAQTLAQVAHLRHGRQPVVATETVRRQLLELTGADHTSLVRLSATELLARIVRASAGWEVRTKAWFLVALLRESGDLAHEEGDDRRGREFHSRALELLLDLANRPEAADTPAFVPTVDALLASLGDATLPPETEARLMQYFEGLGEFGKAEDHLHTLLEALPGVREVTRLGESFYRRLLALNDATLERGNLPRREVEAGLTELRGPGSA